MLRCQALAVLACNIKMIYASAGVYYCLPSTTVCPQLLFALNCLPSTNMILTNGGSRLSLALLLLAVGTPLGVHG